MITLELTFGTRKFLLGFWREMTDEEQLAVQMLESADQILEDSVVEDEDE